MGSEAGAGGTDLVPKSRDAVYSYFPHDADIGISATGKTLEEAFVHAAEAVFSLMTDPGEIRTVVRVDFSFEEKNREFALVEWINLLLSEADIRGLVFRQFELERLVDVWKGKAWGEPWSERHQRGIEVKGATLTHLAVKEGPGNWAVRLVVDV